MGHSGEKTFFVRAPGEIIPDKLIVYRSDFLLRRGARGFSLHFATQTQQKAVARGDFISIVLSHNG